MAQRSRCARQPQRTLCFELNSRGARETLQQARNSTFMIQFSEEFYAFPVKRTRCGIVPLFSRQASQIGERASNSPAVAEFPKDCQALFVQCSRRGEVALIACDIALMVH